MGSEDLSGSAHARSLAGVKLFDGLPADEKAALATLCVWRGYRTGERVLERGSKGSEVFFVIEGAVTIVSYSPNGREVAFGRAGVGETFGELAAIDGEPRSASVVAAEDSLIAAMPGEAFTDVLKRHGEITFGLLQRLSKIVRSSDERILEVSTLGTTNRIYAELLRLAVPDPDAPELSVIRPLPPLRELAARSSTTREHVANALNRLYPTGLIQRKGESLYVMDRRALAEIVAAGGRGQGEAAT
jgi:CRP/FNR family transcriptional regulator, cyclic AMP receptor protein